jgi:RNA polymerase sigma factor (sigma-70 family)
MTGLRRQFETLWNENYRAVFAYAARRIGDAEAGDITAETFLVAWRRFSEAPDPGRVWLLAIARRLLANHVRSHKRREALRAKLASSAEPIEAVAEPVNQSEAAFGVAQAFDELSAGDREVVALVAWDELKPGEAARVLGISAARFSVRLHRARCRLRKKVEAAGHSQVADASTDWPTPVPEPGSGDGG